jgi:hypothetical protein
MGQIDFIVMALFALLIFAIGLAFTRMGSKNSQAFCADEAAIYDSNNTMVSAISGNNLTHRTLTFNELVLTTSLTIKVSISNTNAPVSLFEVRCY